MKKFILLVFVFLIIGGGSYLYFNKVNIRSVVMEKAISHIKEAVTDNISADISSDEINRLFHKVSEKVNSGNFDNEKVEEMVNSIKKYYSDSVIDSIEARKIISDLKKFIGE